VTILDVDIAGEKSVSVIWLDVSAFISRLASSRGGPPGGPPPLVKPD